MTNRLELNWKVDGFVDEQRYYCSETPIDPSNLPAPKAVLAGDIRSYIDAMIDINKTYYILLSSVKSGVEKLSDIKIVNTPEFQIDLKVDAGVFVNHGSTHLNMTWVGSPVFESDAVVLNGTQWLDVSDDEIFNFGTDSFEYVNEVYLTNISQWRILLSAKYSSGASYSQYGFGSGYLYIGESWGGFGSNLAANTAVTINSWNIVKLKRTPTLLELIINDVVVASKSITPAVTFNFNRNASGTRLFNITWSNQNSPFIGKVRRVTLKR